MIDAFWRESLPEPVAAKLDRFESFADGWAYGEGRAFDPAAIRRARVLAELACLVSVFDSIDVFPGRHGQVIVTLYRGNEVHDFAVTADGVRYSLEVGDVQTIEDQEVSMESAGLLLQRFGAFTWRWSEYSLLTNMKLTSKGSKALRSNLSTIFQASQSSKKTVRWQLQSAPAFTRGVSILHRSRRAQPSSTSGVLIHQPSHQGTGLTQRRVIPVTTATGTL